MNFDTEENDDTEEQEIALIDKTEKIFYGIVAIVYTVCILVLFFAMQVLK